MRLYSVASLALSLAVVASASPFFDSPSNADIARRSANDGNSFVTREFSAVPDYKLRVKSPKFCASNVTQYSGYVDTANDKHFFFWFFESRRKYDDKTPLLLWLNGGPGASSMVGMLTENGPCRILPGGNSTTDNLYAWNERAHVVYLDQPIGTGFSYGSNRVNSSIDAGKDITSFLQLFYLSFPQYAKGKLHITGESYAGHFLPATAKAIVEANNAVKNSGYLVDDGSKKKRGNNQTLPILPLASVAIGNGMVNPVTQLKYYPKMACNSTYKPIVDKYVCDAMESAYPVCKRLLEDCYPKDNNTKPTNCQQGLQYCQTSIMNIIKAFNQNNVYDVRIKCIGESCYTDVDDVAKYLNIPSVQKELGVEEGFKFSFRSPMVSQDFGSTFDLFRDYSHILPSLIENGIKLLIYAGDADYAANWYGNIAWVKELEWSGKAGFNKARDLDWVVGKKPAGAVRSFGNLTFLRIYNAGHLVPADQPTNALDMINRWIEGKPFAHGK
ncbi:hypothetical protein GGI12_004702 [Dipsacomyces acuminosporus]|nr:hypothetical protein GGI12_004702 [Dipsacomyces acuminosporus]